MSEDSRLIIHQLVLENFKSYVGSKIIGPLHEAFTSVVGPNGSGKSNVIDAILFVFGYRSTKIRSKKLSLLIHTSERYPNIESCTVSVHFRRIDCKTSVMESNFELIISRTARRDSSNDYYINGKKSSFREVSQMLRDYCVDLDHNRFLILQGEVEQMSLMKPKQTKDGDDGFLEYLEDIIGTNVYNSKIDELSKELEVLDEQRVEKYNRTKLVERERDALAPARNQALAYVEQENCHQKLISIDLFLKIAELNKNNSKILLEYEAITEEKSQLDVIMNDDNKALMEKKRQLKELHRLHNPLIKDIEKYSALVEACEHKCLKLQQDVDYAKKNKSQLENVIEKERQKYVQVQPTLKKNQESLDKLLHGKQVIEEEIKELEIKIEKLLPEVQKKTAHLQAEKEQRNKVLLQKNRVLSEADTKLNASKNALEILTSKRDALHNEIEEIKKKQTELQNEISMKQRCLQNAVDNLPELEKALKDNSEAFEIAKKEECVLLAELKDKRLLLDSIQHDDLSSKSRSKILQALLGEKESGRIPGIYGRLGDLGHVDPKYDCAISSCCGFLDHCVVDTMDTAICCVKFLRNNNLGISSFIALDKMAQYNHQTVSKIQIPNNSQRLFDLIIPSDSLFSSAFYFAIRDTLVVDNIDIGTQIAYSGNTRWRVATLKGEIIEKSGTITCGGDPIHGKINTTATRKHSNDKSSMCKFNVEAIMKDMNEINEKWGVVKQKIASLGSEISLTKDKIRDRTQEIDVIKKELELLEQELPALHTLMQKCTSDYNNSAPDQDKLKLIKLDVDQSTKAKENAKRSCDIVVEQIKKLNDQITAISSEILDTHQTDLDSKRRFFDDINSQYGKVLASIESNQRSLQKAEQSICELQNNLDSATQACFQFEEELKAMEHEFQTQKGHLTKLEAESSDSLQELKSLETHMKSLEERHFKNSQKMLGLKAKADDISDQIRSYESKVHYIKEEFSKLIHRSFTDHGEEIIQAVSEPNQEDLETHTRKELYEKIKQQAELLSNSKPDLAAIEEYGKKNVLYCERSKDLDDFTLARDQKRIELTDLRKKRLDEFMDGFSIINIKLKEMYQLITLGGDAELELVDSLDPFIEGVVFSVRPPNKSWKNIANLSGGEKTLSSLALIFALHHYKPTPFYIMDEIDAALDFKNVSIVATYIREQTQNAQFLIISLRDNMFELANRLIGIYKTGNSTKSVVISIDSPTTP